MIRKVKLKEIKNKKGIIKIRRLRNKLSKRKRLKYKLNRSRSNKNLHYKLSLKLPRRPKHHSKNLYNKNLNRNRLKQDNKL